MKRVECMPLSKDESDDLRLEMSGERERHREREEIVDGFSLCLLFSFYLSIFASLFLT